MNAKSAVAAAVTIPNKKEAPSEKGKNVFTIHNSTEFYVSQRRQVSIISTIVHCQILKKLYKIKKSVTMAMLGYADGVLQKFSIQANVTAYL